MDLVLHLGTLQLARLGSLASIRRLSLLPTVNVRRFHGSGQVIRLCGSHVPQATLSSLIPSQHVFFGYVISSLRNSRGMPFSALCQPRSGFYTVGEFVTRKEDLHVLKPTTSVDEGTFNPSLLLHSGHGDKRITGFPVIDDSWNLTFNEVQKLLSKTNGKVIGDLVSHAAMVVWETTNLEDVARLLLETKFRRLLVLDAEDKLAGIITRGNVVRAALQIKQATKEA